MQLRAKSAQQVRAMFLAVTDDDDNRDDRFDGRCDGDLLSLLRDSALLRCTYGVLNFRSGRIS